MTFNINFITYSGMTIPLHRGVSRDDAKEIVRRRIRRARSEGQPVSKIGKGEWVFETPEDGFMISDQDGYLKVRRAT